MNNVERMKNKHIIICVLGSSVAFLGVCLYLVLKRRGEGEKTTDTDITRRNKPCPRRLNYHVDCGDGLLSGEDIKVRKVGRVTSGSNVDILAQADQSETSLSSLASYDDNSSSLSGEKSNYLNNDSSSTSESSIAGVLQESTYKKMKEKIPLPEELDDLTGSPIVANFLADTRCRNPHRKDDVAHTPSNVVVEFEGDVTPINVNENIHNLSETYSSIVPPLQPNTGTIVSTNT